MALRSALVGSLGSRGELRWKGLRFEFMILFRAAVKSVPYTSGRITLTFMSFVSSCRLEMLFSIDLIVVVSPPIVRVL